MVEPDPDTWEDALTRRLRTLLRTAPLHQLEASKRLRGEAFAGQDLRALGLRALDLAIEHKGLGHGASFEELCAELEPLVRDVDPELAPERALEVATVTLEALLNEAGRRQAFREPYLALTHERVTHKLLEFHLLRERQLPDGTTIIEPTTQAINLYAGMLEYEVEDAQAAEEAVLRSQVRRGRIEDAVRTAKRARLRSIEYEQKLVAFLETTRRDIGQVDWVESALGIIDEAREHISERLEVEREILAAIETRRELESTVQSATLPEAGAQLASLEDTLNECLTRHARLHQRLIRANADYLVEHDRQTFRPQLATPLPDLEAEVLSVALELPTLALADLADELLARCQAPRCPPSLRLGALIMRLLNPRRVEVGDYETWAPELEEVEATPPVFNDDNRHHVAELLAQLRGQQRLSELLTRARARGYPPESLRLLVLELLSAFDPGAANAPVEIDLVDEWLDDPTFRGDELLVRRLAHG